MRVFKLQRDMERMFVSLCFGVFPLYLFGNARGDTQDPLWQGLCYSTKESRVQLAVHVCVCVPLQHIDL